VRVPDPYRWLEDTSSDDTHPWLAAQEALTRCFRMQGMHRDSHASRRFVTIDYWESGELVDSFRAAHAAELEALEARCQRYAER
jgi:prolyl oligopeptidase PreP (S9A serine peptidase family)